MSLSEIHIAALFSSDQVVLANRAEMLDVQFCSPVKRNVMAIENLVMPEDRKMMIKALVEKFTHQRSSQEPSKQWRADWIENKGEGQIFLLHGSPGVGKTFVSA